MKEILDILKLDAHYQIGECIEIAKGKNKLPESYKEDYQQRKRKLINSWLKRK